MNLGMNTGMITNGNQPQKELKRLVFGEEKPITIPWSTHITGLLAMMLHSRAMVKKLAMPCNGLAIWAATIKERLLSSMAPKTMMNTKLLWFIFLLLHKTSSSPLKRAILPFGFRENSPTNGKVRENS